MPAYLFVLPAAGNPNTGTTEALKDYPLAVKKILEEFGGKHLVGHKPTTTLEGDTDRGFVTLVEFPSQEKLMAFYKSDAYRPWLDLRKKVSSFDIFISEDND